jgi:hypothetical protein
MNADITRMNADDVKIIHGDYCFISALISVEISVNPR